LSTSDISDVSDLSDTDTDTTNSGTQTLHGVRSDLSAAYDHAWLKNFTTTCGPLLHSDTTTEIDIFSHFFSADFIDVFVRETNRYATECISKSTLGPASRSRRWTDVTASDMHGFLAILILQSTVKLPKYEMYWTTNCFVELPGIRSLIARDRFEIILQYLHVADNSCLLPSGDPNCDKLFKIRPMLDHLIQQWQSAYHPSRDVSVDESIVAFKGRSHMIVYKPNKSHKWGINAWVLAESQTGYVWNMDLYTGSKSSTEVGMTKTVVTSLCTYLWIRPSCVHGQLLQFTETVSRTRKQRGGSLWHSTSQPPWCT